MNHIGEQIGIYKILTKTEQKDSSGHTIYEIECSVCHKKFYIPLRNLNKKKVAQSCNHKNIKYYKWKNKRLHFIFTNMKARCNNPKNKDYKWYGEKGIKVCQEWVEDPSSFETWAFQNGYKENLTIDRKDENKDYCPENCTWIPLKENSAKKSSTNYITVYNETHSGKEWARILNKGPNFINTKIKKDGIQITIDYIKNNLEWNEEGQLKN